MEKYTGTDAVSYGRCDSLHRDSTCDILSKIAKFKVSRDQGQNHLSSSHQNIQVYTLMLNFKQFILCTV